MAISSDLRHSCSFTVRELEDAVQQYFDKSSEIDAYREQIDKLRQQKRDLEIQLSNTEQNSPSSLESQINELEQKISNSIALMQALKQQRQYTKQLVDQLSNEYDQDQCGQFFHKPRIF